jgi:Loader and inhibitor of phage G40P.
MKRAETIKILRLVRTTWPEIELTDETIMVWTWAFDDLSYAEVQSALQVHMRTSPFAPKPADLRKTVAEAVADTAPWEDAWTEVTGTVKKYGWVLFADGHKTYRESLNWPGWSTPEVEAAVKVIGYRNLCLSEEEDANTLRAQFRDSYNNICKRKQTAAQVGDAALPRGTAAIAMLKQGEDAA